MILSSLKFLALLHLQVLQNLNMLWSMTVLLFHRACSYIISEHKNISYKLAAEAYDLKIERKKTTARSIFRGTVCQLKVPTTISYLDIE